MKQSTSSARTALESLKTVKAIRHQHGALALHPYFGKVDPGLARVLIETLSQPGELVLDPFCGSGTVLHEALLSSRSCLGWDSSPLATLIATTKVSGLLENEDTVLEGISDKLAPYRAEAGLFGESIQVISDVPDMPRVRDIGYWFQPQALVELSFLRDFVERHDYGSSSAIGLVLKSAFSRIIVPASNQQGESSYRRVEKPDHPGRVIDMFLSAVTEIRGSMKEFSSLLLGAGRARNSLAWAINPTIGEIGWSEQRAAIFERDTRIGEAETAQAALVVTSPPYLMSWDYGLYHKFRFYWLGLDLDRYEDTEIGRHLRRKNDDVARYTDDMVRSFDVIDRALLPKAYIALVNAPSVVYGDLVDTNEVLANAARSVGWEVIDCVATIDIPGPHHGMYASLRPRGATAPGESGKREHVLIFRKA